ncbi:hypothetical protein K1719_041749 [Acacia pycnantha]|nr:hypothetical protein K1719_041749 [Acacia pycnantha]
MPQGVCIPHPPHSLKSETNRVREGELEKTEGEGGHRKEKWKTGDAVAKLKARIQLIKKIKDTKVGIGRAYEILPKINFIL